MNPTTMNLSAETMSMIEGQFAPNDVQSKETLIRQLVEEKTRLIKQVIFGNGTASIEYFVASPLNTKKVEWLIQELNLELQDADHVEGADHAEGASTVEVDGFEAKKIGDTASWQIKIKLHVDVLNVIQRFYRRGDKEKRIKIAERELIKALNILKKEKVVEIGADHINEVPIASMQDWLKQELEKEGLAYNPGRIQLDASLVDNNYTPGMISDVAERRFEISLMSTSSKEANEEKSSK